jgi:hypothetical protein
LNNAIVFVSRHCHGILSTKLMDTVICAIQGAHRPRPGLRVSRISGSSEGRVASCRVQLLLLYSEGAVIVSNFRLVDAAERGMQDSLVPQIDFVL